MITLVVGYYGRLKASKREFTIVKTTSTTTTIRFRGERTEYELKDDELRKDAVGIERLGGLVSNMQGEEPDKKKAEEPATGLNPLHGMGYIV